MGLSFWSIKGIKKEVLRECTIGGIDEDGDVLCNDTLMCPICKQSVGDQAANELYFNYCPECGQKLKYTLTKEESELRC